MRDSVILAAFFLGGALDVLAHEANPSRYNYREHVRPIFVEHCAGCHRPGGVAPMSLLEYAEAVPWANAIKMQVLGAHMPPWLPEEGAGRFRHARGLSAEEIDIVVDWAVGLTPEGEPLTREELSAGEVSADMPWRMGKPDLVLAPAAEVVLSEDENERTACLVLPTGLGEPTTVGAFELRPGRPSLVRRATIFLGEGCGGQPLVTWLPGQGEIALAKELPAGAVLAVEILYVKGWEEEGLRLTDRSEVGLRWSRADTPVRARRVDGPGLQFAEAVEIVALYPDPVEGTDEGEEASSTFRIDVVTPGGAAKPLLSIEDYDPRWREKYILEEPLRLPAGSELRLSRPAAWIDLRLLDAAAEGSSGASPLKR